MSEEDKDQLRQVASVPKLLASRRLDHAARLLFPEYSRSLLSQWIRQGRLTLGGHSVLPKHKVSEGDILHLTPEQVRVESEAAAQAMHLDILFEDDAVIVLHKPAGLVVHPGAGHTQGTLMNGLLHHRPSLRALPRAGLVHRLDVGTSGLMLVAASERARRILIEDLAARRVGRLYQAFVEGRMIAGAEFDAPIGRHPRQRTRQWVRADGRDARTSVRVVRRHVAHTLVQARLHTGRTHQIRVHLSHAGFPLVGDSQYGARGLLPSQPTPALTRALRGVSRPMLHARQLTFNHPLDATPMEFSSALPDDMAHLAEALREHTADHA